MECGNVDSMIVDDRQDARDWSVCYSVRSRSEALIGYRRCDR